MEERRGPILNLSQLSYGNETIELNKKGRKRTEPNQNPKGQNRSPVPDGKQCQRNTQARSRRRLYRRMRSFVIIWWWRDSQRELAAGRALWLRRGLRELTRESVMPCKFIALIYLFDSTVRSN